MSPPKSKVPVLNLVTGPCRNGLHDLAVDGVWIIPKTGAATCYPCRRAAKDREFAKRPKAPPRPVHIKPQRHGPPVPRCSTTRWRFTSCRYCMAGLTHTARGSVEYRDKKRAERAAARGLTIEQHVAAVAENRRLKNRLRSHQRRLRARDARVRSKPRFMVRHYQRELRRGTCFYCAARIPDGEMDHVIPLARGGDHSEGNTVLACVPCNQSKGSMLVIEWRVSDAYLPGMGF